MALYTWRIEYSKPLYATRRLGKSSIMSSLWSMRNERVQPCLLAGQCLWTTDFQTAFLFHE